MSRPAIRVGFAAYVVTATAVTAFVFLEFASWGGFVGWLHAAVSAVTCGCTAMLLFQFRRALRRGFDQGSHPVADRRPFREWRKKP